MIGSAWSGLMPPYRRSLRSGHPPFIVKPLNRSRLLQTIQDLITGLVPVPKANTQKLTASTTFSLKNSFYWRKRSFEIRWVRRFRLLKKTKLTFQEGRVPLGTHKRRSVSLFWRHVSKAILCFEKKTFFVFSPSNLQFSHKNTLKFFKKYKMFTKSCFLLRCPVHQTAAKGGDMSAQGFTIPNVEDDWKSKTRLLCGRFR